MDARYSRALVVVAAFWSLGANYSYRTANFLISAPTEELAAEIGEMAEQFRRDLAIEWLGSELPRWDELCPIHAIVQPQMPAGGQTSFYFTGGRPRGWEMVVQGSRERVLDSVLPHEVTHTIFATHFGRPLPRWADEGACTTVEHVSERAKQDELLIRFLTTKPTRGIAFNELFVMEEYPQDILPLYSQGYSLARYLIAQGGKRKFVQYVGDGMRTRNWTQATRAHYGFRSLAELQQTWLQWVAVGSPLDAARPPVALASFEEPAAATPAPPADQVAAAGSTGSWYARQRDKTVEERGRLPAASTEVRETSRPPNLQPLEPIMLESARTSFPASGVIRR